MTIGVSETVVEEVFRLSEVMGSVKLSKLTPTGGVSNRVIVTCAFPPVVP